MTPLSNSSPLLSIITVVFNNASDIERTLRSVVGQSYKQHVEYIIIDGGSTDGTLGIIQQYKAVIDVLVSEPDNGIYHAMNKGLALAKGTYVLFMNSGDELYAYDTVEKVFSLHPNADIYYGETEMINAQGNSLGRRRHHIPRSFNWKSFRFGMSISHQAIYIRKSLTIAYDTYYSLSADIDWIIKAAKKAKVSVNTQQYVAKYLTGGISKKKHWQSLKERFHIFSQHYGLLPNILNHVVIALRLAYYYARHGRTND